MLVFEECIFVELVFEEFFKYKFLLRSSSSRRVSAMLNACRVSPGHEVRP